VKAADAAVAAEESKGRQVRADVEAERARLEGELVTIAGARSEVEGKLPAELVTLFADSVAKRRGIAVAAVRDGHCEACQVRLRPQLIMEIRKGDRIVQCESCMRILYAPPAAPVAAPAEGDRA
jgi:predicted  nucleic acid-binding Zn-ribbon protein